MRLTELLSALPDLIPAGADPDITALTADSRDVTAGTLFAALPGANADGRTFIPQALKKGAAAVLVPADTPALDTGGVPVIQAPAPRRALALMAARFHNGAQPVTVVAVTGTNGKTSTVSFLRQLWRAAGWQAASLGTLGLTVNDEAPQKSLTTPEPVALHALLADLAAQDVNHLAMEASSHGLDQARLDGVRLTAAGFTNLSRDHLDYHSSMEAYQSAKTRLFTEVLPSGGVAVLPADTPAGKVMIQAATVAGRSVRTVGKTGDLVALTEVAAHPEGLTLTLSLNGEAAQPVTVPVAGLYQAENLGLAAALALITGMTPAAVRAALPTVRPVPGRLQPVATSARGAPVFIDYAHTPDALTAALQSLRPHVQGRLITVFGAGGDRDPGKRTPMGAAVAEHSDLAIISDDNPRTEDPAAIRAAVQAGCPKAENVGDRRAAIHRALALADAGDLILIAGKGHETGQEIQGTTLPFDDAEVAAACAVETGGQAR